MSKQTPSTANDAYTDGQVRVKQAIADLQARLRVHAKRQTGNRRDWCYPGDLGRVLVLLDEAKAGLTDKE